MTDFDWSGAGRSITRARRWLERFEDYVFDEDGQIERLLSARRSELRSKAPPAWGDLQHELDQEGSRLEVGLTTLLRNRPPSEVANALSQAVAPLAASRLALHDVDFDGDPRDRYRYDRDCIQDRAADAASTGIDVGGSCPVPDCFESRGSAGELLHHFREHPPYKDGVTGHFPALFPG